MKTVLKKIITIGICVFFILTTCSLADAIPPDTPLKPNKNKNEYYVSEEPIATPYVEGNTITSNTTNHKSKHSSDEDDEDEVNYAVILIAVAGTIAVVTAISIVILAFTSKKDKV